MALHSVGDSSAWHSDQSLDRLIEGVTHRLQAGEIIDLACLIESAPEYAEQLRLIWPGLMALASLGCSGSIDGMPSLSHGFPCDFQNMTLGDFRIVREIGRGGMGVVYEAEQTSLGRQVALKVFPFTGLLDQRQLQRFKNEARAAASLHHPNIVPVHSVGSDRGIHFYAMQLIHGRTIAEIIGQHLKSAMQNPTSGISVGSLSAQHHRPESPTKVFEDLEGISPSIESIVGTAAPKGFTTLISEGERDHFRVAANFCLQVANALQYAHDLGIVHRDVKPSNLIVEQSGRLWVTDFGLARVQNEANLTLTGELLGTLRYMSPEQIDSTQAVLDHRCDVYSLGATLYELLALRPVFLESARHKLIRQILYEEPLPPRKFNRAIPHELETIVLNCTLGKQISPRN